MASGFAGTLEFAKVLMALFVMVYAYFFLRSIKRAEDARPWQFLFVASMFLFVTEVVSAYTILEKGGLPPQMVDLREFLEFGFLSFFLFSFIYQHYLLINRGDITIKGSGIPASKMWELSDKFKENYLKLERKIEGEDGPDPEEEFKKEASKMEKEEDIKKEEDELKKVVKK